MLINGFFLHAHPTCVDSPLIPPCLCCASNQSNPLLPYGDVGVALHYAPPPNPRHGTPCVLVSHAMPGDEGTDGNDFWRTVDVSQADVPVTKRALIIMDDMAVLLSPAPTLQVHLCNLLYFFRVFFFLS